MKYKTQIASDIQRNGLGLELIDENFNVLAEIFRSDTEKTIYLNIFSRGIEEQYIQKLIIEAEERLGPFDDGTRLPEINKTNRRYLL